MKAPSDTGALDGETKGREDAERLKGKEAKTHTVGHSRTWSRIQFCDHNEWATFVFRSKTTSPQSSLKPIT